MNKNGIEATKLALKTGKAQPPYELELKGEKGRVIWVQVNESPLIENGKVVGIVGSLTDITALKKTTHQLEEQKEELEKINQLMVGRELKMVDLKEEIARLRQGAKTDV